VTIAYRAISRRATQSSLVAYIRKSTATTLAENISSSKPFVNLLGSEQKSLDNIAGEWPKLSARVRSGFNRNQCGRMFDRTT
jgi:hypothetical protein